MTHDHLYDRVSQELQPFVIFSLCRALVEEGTMDEGLGKELRAAEAIGDLFLQVR
jgi:hypothetical protein